MNILNPEENVKVALFIDAENISHKAADFIVSSAKSYGDLIVKKIYADWSKPSVKDWKDAIGTHSLMTEHQFTFSKGKNASDISLMIDAICYLFEKRIDVFCLATGDSDFTRLVQVLRARDKKVIGFGRSNAMPSLINSFNEYLYIDQVNKSEQNSAPQTAQSKETKQQKTAQSSGSKSKKSKNNAKNNSKASKLTQLLESMSLSEEKYSVLCDIVEKLISDGQRAFLAQISNDMKNQYADFVPKNYGCKGMRELINQLLPYMGNYELAADGTVLFVRETRPDARGQG